MRACGEVSRDNMRLGAALLLAATGTACGIETRGADIRAPKPVVSVCRVTGLGLVRGEVSLDCDAVHSDYALLREIMADRDILPDRSTVFWTTSVLVIDDDEVLRDDGQAYNGYFLSSSGVTLARTTSGTGALLHELLHALQVSMGVPNTGLHLGWETNGYYAAD